MSTAPTTYATNQTRIRHLLVVAALIILAVLAVVAATVTDDGPGTNRKEVADPPFSVIEAEPQFLPNIPRGVQR